MTVGCNKYYFQLNEPVTCCCCLDRDETSLQTTPFPMFILNFLHSDGIWMPLFYTPKPFIKLFNQEQGAWLPFGKFQAQFGNKHKFMVSHTDLNQLPWNFRSIKDPGCDFILQMGHHLIVGLILTYMRTTTYPSSVSVECSTSMSSPSETHF